MDYRLENLSTGDFERLVNMLCQRVLGMGTVSFSEGKDGGRDGRFEGTANNYPSCKESWKGKFIIQAKHASSHAASCSDNDFFSDTRKKCVINEEILKIQELKALGEVEHYLLFTNRKESVKREGAVKHIKAKTGLNNVDIIGKETLHSWLLQHDDIAKAFKIGKYELPLTLTAFDIKNVIIAFGKQSDSIRAINVITDDQLIISISKEEKNRFNNLSQKYYDNQIRRHSLQYFQSIDEFLSDFQNDSYAKMYENFARELSNKIDIKRESFGKFEEVFMFLYDLIFEENKIELGQDQRFIWIFLHHLYFNCHIGVISAG